MNRSPSLGFSATTSFAQVYTDMKSSMTAITIKPCWKLLRQCVSMSFYNLSTMIQ